MQRFAESSCAMFYASDEVVKGDKKMNVMALVPSQEAWEAAKQPQRSIYCLAWPRDGSTTSGSIVPDEDS